MNKKILEKANSLNSKIECLKAEILELEENDNFCVCFYDEEDDRYYEAMTLNSEKVSILKQLACYELEKLEKEFEKL